MLTRSRLVATVALFATLSAAVVYAQNPNQTTKGQRNAGNNNGGGNNGGGGGFGGGGGPGGGGFGGGPGGGGFGGGPGGGGPGGGGPGGRGNQGPANDSPERLLQIESVQDDLKLDDKVKAKFKTLGEDATKQRTKTRETVTKAATSQAQQLAAQENAAMAEALAAQGIIVDPKTLNQNNNNGGGGRGGRGGNNGPGGGQAAQFERQMMTVAMNSLASKVDAAFLKLLTTKQKDRLKQIVLQQEGARAFTRPDQDVVEKLGLTEEQLTNIQNVNRDLQQQQRQGMQDFFTSFASANNIDLNAGNNNNNGGGNNNNGGGGGRGGRGGFPNMGNMDEATRAKFGTAMGEYQAKSNTATMEAIGKFLTKAQKSKYTAMTGEPFDVATLRGPGPGAPGGPGGPGAPGAAGAPGDPATTAATKGATPPADAAKATPKKGSLRDARGGN